MKIFLVTLTVILVDQISKMIIKGFTIPFLKIFHGGMYQGESISVIGNFFRITFIENPGMAFGFDPGFNMKLWLSLFSLVASIGLAIYLYFIRDKNFTLKLSIALILGGAIGNLIDRMFYGIFYGYAPLFYGKVVDFLDFDFFKFSLFGKVFDRWPIFNFADAAVTIGVLILIVFYRASESESKVSQTNVPTNPDSSE
ncbi:MAG TPA: signal peptidase II [Ignavibacteriaceae bacterium]|nr:signal peptidase II [Ignavibacteriaceae bacterium]